MLRPSACWLLVLQVFIYTLHAQEGLIIQSPKSMVAALGTNVTFTCIAIGSILWSINGVQIFPNIVENFLQAGIFVPPAQPNMSTVTIRAGPLNNNTFLSCLVEDTEFVGIKNISEVVYFTSYGAPSLPSNLTVTVMVAERGFMLTWNAGFIHQGEDVTFVLSLVSEQTTTMTEVNMTSAFLATPSNGRECLLYMFILHAKNGIGLSEDQLTATRLAPTAPNILTSSDIISSTSLLNAEATINITFQDLSPCLEFKVHRYDLILMEVASSQGDPLPHNSIMLYFNASSVSDGGVVTLTLGGDTLKVDRQYAVILSATNNVSSSKTNFTLYTTGLQRCQVIVDTSTLSANITCFFATHTSAMGCYVFFMNNLLANLTLDSGAVVAMATVQLPEGSRVDEILVSEVLADGTVGNITIMATITMTTPASTTNAPTGSGSSNGTGSDGAGGVSGAVVVGVLGGVAVAAVLILVAIIIILGVLLSKKPSKHEVEGEKLKHESSVTQVINSARSEGDFTYPPVHEEFNAAYENPDVVIQHDTTETAHVGPPVGEYALSQCEAYGVHKKFDEAMVDFIYDEVRTPGAGQ